MIRFIDDAIYPRVHTSELITPVQITRTRKKKTTSKTFRQTYWINILFLLGVYHMMLGYSGQIFTPCRTRGKQIGGKHPYIYFGPDVRLS